MKRWLIVGLLALACPLAAQKATSYDAPELQVPQAIYDALTQSGVQDMQMMMASKKAPESLLLENEEVRGLVVIEVGDPGCSPCNRLLADLKRKNDQGQSVIDGWKAQGIRFFQLHGNRDLARVKQGLPSLCKSLGIRSFPYLLLVKDGQLVGALSGYPSDPEPRAQKKAEIEEMVRNLTK